MVHRAFLVAQLVKNSTCNARELGLVLGLGRSLEERLPTPVFWPGEFHGLYSPWARKESDTTGLLSLYGLSQDTEYSSLCYIVGPCRLSIYNSLRLLIPNSQSIPPLLAWQPQVCSPGLRVCFCFVDKSSYLWLLYRNWV